MQGKRYTYDDPLLRLYVRLHVRPVPPTDADIVREVRAYAQARAACRRRGGRPTVPVAAAVGPRRRTPAASSGIIEID